MKELYANSSVARIFLRTARPVRASHTFMRHSHAWFMVTYKVCCVRMSSLLISPSPFSCFIRLRLLFLHGHFETNLTDAFIHTVLQNFPDPKSGSSALPQEDEQFGCLAKPVTQHRNKQEKKDE